MAVDKYQLDFILNTYNTRISTVESSLKDFGDNLRILPDQRENNVFHVSLETSDPTLVFDICAQFGRIKSVKVN